MSLKRLFLFAILVPIMFGCASMPQVAELHKGADIFNDRSRVGVRVQVRDGLPTVWESDPARGGNFAGLIQAGLVALRTQKLTSHAKGLPVADLKEIEIQILKELTARGIDAVVIHEKDIKDFKPERFQAKDGSYSPLDLRPLRERLGIERLLTVSVIYLGFNYPFSGVIPIASGDPMAHVRGAASIVDLRTNAYQWLRRFDVLRGVGEAWDSPPAYPALTEKYFEAIEIAKEEILRDLFR
jgi:hypothetical protein